MQLLEALILDKGSGPFAHKKKETRKTYMTLGLKKNGPQGFSINAGTGAHTYDQDANASTLEQAFGTGTNGITARAGGGQGSATALTTTVNRVATVATIGDSVLLPATTNGTSAPVVVFNAAANSLNVFPATGDAINAGAANAAFAVAGGKTAIFYCVAPGLWVSILTA
jgi:hypothetical protein